MRARFLRIKSEFGTVAFVRTLIMLIGLVGMSVLGVFGFLSFLPGMIAISGMIAGFLLRNRIPDGVDHYSTFNSIATVSMGIVLFLGDFIGLENHVKLSIITAVTTLIFNLQFWTFSDDSIVAVDR